MPEPLRFLLDENIPAFVAQALRTKGLDAVHVEDIGLKGASDSLLMTIGAAEGQVIVTRDRRDFLRLADHHRARKQSAAPVILVSHRFSIDQPGVLIEALTGWAASALRREDPIPGGILWLPLPSAGGEGDAVVREAVPRYMRALERVRGEA